MGGAEGRPSCYVGWRGDYRTYHKSDRTSWKVEYAVMVHGNAETECGSAQYMFILQFVFLKLDSTFPPKYTVIFLPHSKRIKINSQDILYLMHTWPTTNQNAFFLLFNLQQYP